MAQLLSHVWLFAILSSEETKTPLSSTVSRSLLKFMSIESVTLSNHLILCHSLLFFLSVFPSIRVFSNESALHIRLRPYWASASAPVLPMNIQGWFPLGLTDLISLQSKGLSRVFSSTIIWKHQFFSTQPSLWSNSHICTWLLEKPSSCYRVKIQQVFAGNTVICKYSQSSQNTQHQH